MTTIEQRRAWVLTKVMAGEVEVGEAAALLGLSVRSVWRLKRRFSEEGPAGLVHGNRGRVSPRRIDEPTRDQVRGFARGRYDGANDSHLAELLAEREGITLSRISVRRILRAAGIASRRRRRAPRHRSRRDRMPQAGMLLQTDGSRRFNRQFAVPAADPEPAWRALPADLSLDAVCSLKYRRVVARDNTVRAGATILQLPARSGARSHAGRRVELQLRLDGRLVVWDGQRTILVQTAPADPVQLRALQHARAELGSMAPSVGSAAVPAATHPWRHVTPGSKLYERKQRERLPESRIS